MNLPVLFSVLVGVGLFLIFLGLDLIVSARTIPLEKRVDLYKPTLTQQAADEKKTPGSTVARVTPEVFQRQIAAELSRANLPVTVSEYVTANLLTTALGFLIGFGLFQENLLMAVVFAIIGFIAPRFYLRYLQGKRLEAFEDALPGTLVLLANSLRAGYGWSQAVETVAKESAPPISTEFARVNREISLGLSSEAALDNLLRRNPSLDLELAIIAINVNRQVGGNLSEILDQIAGTIRDRVRLEEEVRTLTAQQRFTAAVLILLPPIVAGVIYIMNSGYIALLWETSCGIAMSLTSIFLMAFGFVVIRRVLAVKF